MRITPEDYAAAEAEIDDAVREETYKRLDERYTSEVIDDVVSRLPMMRPVRPSWFAIARLQTAQTRTPPQPQYDDGYGDTIDAMTDPIVQGGQGRDERDLMETGNAIVGLFWGVVFSGAIVATAILVKGWVW